MKKNNVKLWVARDLNGLIYLHLKEPTLEEHTSEYMSQFFIELPTKSFPEVTYDNSPQMVELNLVNEITGAM